MTQAIALILGAKSDIAMATAHHFARAGYDIQLAARNVGTLVADQSDISLRYQVAVSLYEFDALEIEAHEKFVTDLPQLPSVAVCAVGFMVKQRKGELDVLTASLVMRSNFEGPASIMGVLANKFEERGNGCLVGISSVAGERGRASNYIYGSAKAGFTAYLSGLRNRLAKKGVHVVSVLPGFVNTKMTEKMELPPRLTAEPDALAQEIYRAVKRRKDIVYHKRVWVLIMSIVRNIPELIFKRLDI